MNDERSEEVKFKVGMKVAGKDDKKRLFCGSCVYPYAIVVSVEPFVLVSQHGDMLWRNVSPDKVNIIDHSASEQAKAIAMLRWNREELADLRAQLAAAKEQNNALARSGASAIIGNAELREQLAESKAECERLSVACKRAVEMNSDNVRAWEQDAAAKDATIAAQAAEIERLKEDHAKEIDDMIVQRQYDEVQFDDQQADLAKLREQVEEQRRRLECTERCLQWVHNWGDHQFRVDDRIVSIYRSVFSRTPSKEWYAMLRRCRDLSVVDELHAITLAGLCQKIAANWLPSTQDEH